MTMLELGEGVENKEAETNGTGGGDLVEGNREFERKAVDEWQWMDVLQWILSLDGGQFAAYQEDLERALREEQVNGGMLHEVNDSTVSRWGVDDFIDRHDLLTQIRTLLERTEKQQDDDNHDTLLEREGKYVQGEEQYHKAEEQREDEDDSDDSADAECEDMYHVQPKDRVEEENQGSTEVVITPSGDAQAITNGDEVRVTPMGLDNDEQSSSSSEDESVHGNTTGQ